MFDTNTAISGNWGSVKINGDLCAEVIGLEAKITIKKDEVKQTGTYETGYKTTGTEGKGTVKLNKVYSRFILLAAENIKAGKPTVVQIESLLADPASDGKEGVVLNGCLLDELPLADWEAGKIGEESIPFTFSSFEITDTIDVPAA